MQLKSSKKTHYSWRYVWMKFVTHLHHHHTLSLICHDTNNHNNKNHPLLQPWRTYSTLWSSSLRPSAPSSNNSLLKIHPNQRCNVSSVPGLEWSQLPLSQRWQRELDKSPRCIVPYLYTRMSIYWCLSMCVTIASVLSHLVVRPWLFCKINENENKRKNKYWLSHCG